MSESSDFPRDRHGRVQCPNCKTFRIPDIIIDVRKLPIPEDWACDACWTHWQRTNRVIDGGPKIAGDWSLRWVIAHGAPPDIVRKFDR